jgi:uncharacterized protein (TIGR02466 family)
MSIENTQPQDVFQPLSYFASTIYQINKSEFLEPVRTASMANLAAVKQRTQQNETYPVTMSEGLMGLPELHDFEQFIAQAGWVILDAQGYKMDGYVTYVSELWCQEHRKYSGMEYHVHPHGVMLSGFYFLDTPTEGCMIDLHDPRPGKVQASLPEKDMTKITDASHQVLFKPEPGMLVIANSWLPHSFTRNASDEPCRFIHFNISIKAAETQPAPIVV